MRNAELERRGDGVTVMGRRRRSRPPSTAPNGDRSSHPRQRRPTFETMPARIDGACPFETISAPRRRRPRP